MKKVLMVGPVPPPRGGIASMMEEILNSELSDEYAFDVFSGPFSYPPGLTGLIGKNIVRTIRYLKFYNKCRKGGYRLMHIHSPGHHFLGTTGYICLARLAGTKVLLHLHGNDWNLFYVEASPIKKWLLRLGLFSAARIVVLQRVWENEIRKLGVRAKVSVLPNMIPDRTGSDATELDETRRSFGLGKDDFLVLSVGVGVVERNKGFFDLFKAVPVIAEQADSVRFLLAGAEEEPGQMALALEIIERENLGRWIRVLGDVEREKVCSLMELASVFLLSSYVEGMPMGVIEAMRSGAAVVATPVGAIPEMVEDRVSGFIISPGAPEEIARAILKLVGDESLRLKLVEAGRKVFAEKYDLTEGIDTLRSIYRELENDRKCRARE